MSGESSDGTVRNRMKSRRFEDGGGLCWIYKGDMSDVS